MKLLQNYLWVVLSANDCVDICTFSYTRRGAVKNFIVGADKDWEYYKDLGCRVIKVSMQLKEL